MAETPKNTSDAPTEAFDLVRARGETVALFATLEQLLDGLILFEYAAESKRQVFWLEVLADEQFSFALRRNLFAKILERYGLNDAPGRKMLESLFELGNRRNKIAHVGKLGWDGEKIGYAHPKKAGELLDLEHEYTTFLRLNEQVTEFLLLVDATVRERSGGKQPASATGSPATSKG